jgi:hypothetical protein
LLEEERHILAGALPMNPRWRLQENAELPIPEPANPDFWATDTPDEEVSLDAPGGGVRTRVDSLCAIPDDVLHAQGCKNLPESALYEGLFDQVRFSQRLQYSVKTPPGQDTVRGIKVRKIRD